MQKTKILVGLASAIFLSFLTFWVILAVKGLQGETHSAEIFSALYGLMALFGGLVGLKVSKRWGGFKSLIGRSVMYMSLGLLAQELGQVTYSAYTYIFHQEIPYPSLGDIGFYGSAILYTLAAFTLIKALSTKGMLSSKKNRLAAAIIPLILLSVSYLIFLRGYSFAFDHPLTIFLDFGYPLTQAFYLSLGILAFLFSYRYLGGIMRPVVLFLIFALFLQYMADFTFLYQTSRDTWKTAGVNELLYLSAYFVMTLSLIKFESVLEGLSKPAGSNQ